jgi:hypothetical protein
MALESQSGILDQAPFFDDFDEDKNFHRVLFRPAVAVQARELTQLQTILQNQIERFGENVFKTGTVIKGCTQTFDSNYQYIKILDNQVDGQPCNVNLYANTLLLGTSGLRAYVVNQVGGLQSQDPDLNTLFVKYLNTGDDGETKTFSVGSTVTSFHRDRRVESVNVILGGTLYSNTDLITFTSAASGGVDAQASIITFANGTIREVVMVNKGTGYIDPPSISITTSSGTGANLSSSIQIAQLSVANSFYSAPIGTGYAMHVSDGVIFQKGHFVRFDANVAVVSKYSISPNNAVVGFVTAESVVNSTADATLLDNASGSLNFKAPGAYRLKLIPSLVVKTKEQAQSNSEFFSIVEFQNGNKVKQTEETQYNVIGGQLAKRTYEESGNYVVSRFPVTTEPISGNTTHLNATVGAGIAYVEGFRVENLDNLRLPLRKSTDTDTDAGQSISTNYGNYVLVEELAGTFGASTGASVSLRDTASNYLSGGLSGAPAAAGSQIGTAKVRAVVYESGDIGAPSCLYRVYLFDIQMSSGKSFSLVRSIVSVGNAVADTVIVQNKSVIQENEYNGLVFPIGTNAVVALNNENFIYRTSITQTSLFSDSGNATIQLGSQTAEEYPYTKGRTLNNTQERDFIIVPLNTVYGEAKTGEVVTDGTTTVLANTNSSTAFLTEYNVGESIKIGSNYYQIVSIVNNSQLTVNKNVTTGTSQAHSLAFPAFVPISTQNRAGAGVAIDGTGKIATITLGSNIGTLSNAINATVHFNIKVVGSSINSAIQSTKEITKGVYVKISGSALAANPNGPWSLGIPDVHKIQAVYKGSSSSYTETNNVTSSFELDNGQRDNFYGLAFLKRRQGAALTLASSDNLLIKLEVYTRNSNYYLSAESYPVDDATVPLPGNKIRTQEIEVYTSTVSGKALDLRDCIDFRPVVANTANVAAITIAGATIDPSISTVLDTNITSFFPMPNAVFSADIVSYKRRTDRIIADSTGQIRIVEGRPANAPVAPVEPGSCMTLALINVPPFPSLSSTEARTALRPDLATSISLIQQRRYTMKDIQDIDSRISRIEYYSLLNTLEQSTKNLVIPSEANTAVDRFKNGFFVDAFDNYDIANVNDPEYKMFIDVYNSEARPRVQQHNIQLEYRAALNSGEDTTLQGDHVVLDYEEVPFMEQPFATKFRNCVENAYNYKGELFTFPAYDNFYDTDQSYQSIDVDIAGALQPVIDATNEAFNVLGGKVTITNSVTNERLVGTSVTRVGGGRDFTSTFQQNTIDTGTLTTASISAGQSTSSTQLVGNYVTNFALLPYIRPQAIKIVAVGLRPGAKHYVFFDKTIVSSFCQPADVTSGVTFREDSFFPKGSVGDVIFASSEGVVSCIFYVPAGTFPVGEREILILDVDDINSQTAGASRAVGSFNAYNFSVEKQELSFNTKTLQSVKTTINVTDYVNTTRGTVNRTQFVRDPPSDPIAQTFRVQPPEPGADGVILTSLDLYFYRKDPALGIVVELREVLLGTPSSTIIPNSRVRKASSQINISIKATTATTFTFDSPVYLKTDREYAFVVYPETGTPEYLIWTGEAGGFDVTNPTIAKKTDWGLGAMFLSTNGTAWTPFQQEDVKFTFKRAKFTASTGLSRLTHKGYEFLTVSNNIGSFTQGEVVAQKGTTYGPGIVYANTQSRVVNGLNTAFTTNLTVGDRILLVYGTNKTTAKQGNVSGTIASTTITGDGTNFTVDYAVGDYIQIGNNVREIKEISNNTIIVVDGSLKTAASGDAHHGVTPNIVVARVLSIASATQITLDTTPPLDSSVEGGTGVVANYQQVVSGIVDSYNDTTRRLVLNSSTTANSSFKLLADRGIVGSISQAVANIDSIDNINISFIEPHLQIFHAPGTSTLLDFTVSRASNNQTVSIVGEMGIANRISFPAVLKSRTNEVSGASFVDSFSFQQTLNSGTSVLSPLVDLYPGSIVVVENVVDDYQASLQTANTFSNSTLQTDVTNIVPGMGVTGLGIPLGTIVTSVNASSSQLILSNDANLTLDEQTVEINANEIAGFGVSTNRYVSKRLSLSDGLDAEDIKVYITCFKPSGTEVEIYAKILHTTDGDNFQDKNWSPLQQATNIGVYSDSLNLNDYRDFEYTFRHTPPSIRASGTVTTNSSCTTLDGFGTEFDSELVEGDFIRISTPGDDDIFDIRKVTTVTDFNTIVVDVAPSANGDGQKIYKVIQPYTAFKNKRNDSIVRYYNQDGAFFDTYKYLAIKIVLRSENSAIVPAVQDIRALAVSI